MVMEQNTKTTNQNNRIIMKTAVQDVLDIIEMEHNNGVEISQRVLYKMLLEAKEKEKQQIIDAFVLSRTSDGCNWDKNDATETANGYYNETYNTK